MMILDRAYARIEFLEEHEGNMRGYMTLLDVFN